jgi:hypothetical protein
MNLAPRLAGMALLLVLGRAVIAGEAAPADAPDLKKLAAVAAKTAAKMKTTPCSWRCVFTREMPGQVIVDVLRTPKMRRITVSGSSGADRKRILRIVERDGAWYVTQFGGLGGRGKYRPFEAPLKLTTLYLYLLRAELYFVAADTPQDMGGSYESSEKGTATYRIPLPKEIRQQMARMVADFEAAAKIKPEILKDPKRRAILAEIKTLLAAGAPTRIDLATGMLLEFGSQRMRTRVENFRWRKEIPDREFAINGDWEDFTGDPTLIDLSRTVIFGHAPGPTEPDNVLLDLRTGSFRRIPFRGAVSLSGCFLKGRKKVVVAGTNMLAGCIGLYEIDLSSGANRQLGGKLLATGFTLFPVLSPDGKTLAVYHKSGDQSIVDVQVCLVDLASGNARKLGKPMSCAHLAWSADGKSLLMTVRKGGDLLKPSKDFLARMNLKGEVTELRNGSRPIALPGDKGILFLDDDGLWKTCNAAGKEARQFGDGLKGCSTPTLSPDGKQLIMMRGDPRKGLQPILVDIKTGKTRALKVPPGNWLFPSWR